MGVRFDFKDVEKEINDAPAKVKAVFDREGGKAVAYAVQSGTYQNRTGRLRSSNRYEADTKAIRLINDAEYASNVEARGYEVLSGSFLRMVNRIETNDNGK